MNDLERLHVQQALGGRSLTPQIEAAYATYAEFKAGLGLGDVRATEIPGILLAVAVDNETTVVKHGVGAGVDGDSSTSEE